MNSRSRRAARRLASILATLLGTLGTWACWNFDFSETSAKPDAADATDATDAAAPKDECSLGLPVYQTNFVEAGTSDWIESAKPGQVRLEDGGGVRVSLTNPPSEAATIARGFDARDYAVQFEFRVLELQPSAPPESTLRIQQLTSSDNTYNVGLFRAAEGWSVAAMLMAGALFRSKSDDAGTLAHVVYYRVRPSEDGGPGGSIQVRFDGVDGPLVRDFSRIPVRSLQLGPTWVGAPPANATVTVVFKNVSFWSCGK
ncbi:MAG: hypothetical protein IPF92_07290 [Myxococcales bacterium]|nr:hypothetical protein [Myxococcales bacterium]MBL0197414.1 hypothetical protein [Myxococcales bacterium]